MNLSTAATGDCEDNKFANILLTNLSTAGAQDCQKRSLIMFISSYFEMKDKLI